ncbi:FtsX-like permease family protein [Leptospira sp. 2 VSF19]|uniref:FtsX-like permease family protein n=1 Tax=Leptospira soteropolitanensis TaxID=2950025 RepID=A0AAW5VCN6_9LEPT|nr:FtsX-like permease family protein [Leptospira soteropolitanensis]MCW7491802.1 FtsX-like permease family protein [Leptospira soteropolitanensis]MCW7499386.1 FtsX-like permease family protein [Leptospira soteropolitanensis]MCW7521023.1 FtsX-like permease family protein [Leptospira soteropolitanensis]MCW7525490.1 FtsX-like permease family protein [Leptospira soteropolitanensis]MCW7529356.1 FtsX-like permease family protein [Leptospira soteropolitanensis]
MKVSLFRFYLKRELFSRFRYSLLIVVSITLGVGSVIGIHSYKDNTANAIKKEAKSIMGADIALQSPQEITKTAETLVETSLPKGSETSASIQFLSMISNESGEENSLSFIKAVETNYPFYGEMKTEPEAAYRNLQPNQVLLDKSLVENLKLKIGDRVRLGDSLLVLAGVVVKEPGAVGSFVGSAPGSIIRKDTANKTGLVQRGSRIRYTIYAKFPETVDSLGWKDKEFEALIKEDLTIYHNTEVNSGSQQFIKNTFDYMALLALAGFFLGAISVYTAVRTRLIEKRNEIAILMCLGAKPNAILLLVFAEILILSILGTTLGLILGYGIQSILPDISGLMSVESGIVFGLSFSSLLWSLVLGVVLPLLISIPLVLETRSVKPLAALKEVESQTSGNLSTSKWQFGSFLLIYILFTSLAILETESIFKGILFTLVLLTLPVLVYGLYVFLGLLITKISKWGWLSKEWSLVTKKVTRKSGALRLSIIGLGSALFILTLSLILQESLLELSGAREIERRPNLFLLDIRETQKDDLLKTIRSFPVEKQYLAPVIGARLSKVNGEPIKKEDTIKNAMDRNWRATARTREYFLSYRDELYDTEEVTKGAWWEESGRNEISVERDFAGYLQAGVGDELTFNVQGREVSGKISNLRSVNWADMKPNFVVLFSKGILEKAPRFYIISLLIDSSENRYQLQKVIVNQFPNITVIDTEKTIQAFMGILEKVTQMMALMTAFILAASFVLVFTTLYASQSERKREFALLRVIGANSRFMVKHFLREALLVSVISFLLGLVYSVVSNEVLNRSVLELRSVYPYGQLTLVFVGICFVTVSLYALGLFSFFRMPTKTVLKEIK